MSNKKIQTQKKEANAIVYMTVRDVVPLLLESKFDPVCFAQVLWLIWSLMFSLYQFKVCHLTLWEVT
jgi:hypothetical protein